MKHLQIGQFIAWKHSTGVITFIDESYLTMCISETAMHPDDCVNAFRKTHQCCILIYKQNWHEINILSHEKTDNLSTSVA